MYKIFLVLILIPVLATAQVKKKQVVRQRTVTKVGQSTVPQQSGNHEVAAPPPPPPSAPDTSGAILGMVDVLPAFPGGRPAWVKFLQTNVDASAVTEDDQQSFGRRQSVKVQFIVCEDGSLCNYKVINAQEVGHSAAREALRVMRKSPNWEAGKVKDQKVKTRFIQPITFQFEE